MVTVEIYEGPIVKAVQDAFEESMYWLQRQFIMEFTSNKWAWPSGQSPRDIVDSGLLRSQTKSPPQARLTPTIYEWTWEAEYALAVHNGATFIKGPYAGRIFPARSWTKHPLDKLLEFFTKEAVKRLKGIQ